MTSEVAILNRGSVALAADSALTTGLPGREKVFYGATKIFTLSKYHPVGVMVYGSSNFFSIPWETVVKTYRAQLGKRSFSTVSEYKEDFLQYISQDRFVTEKEQDFYILIATMFTVATLMNNIREHHRKWRVKDIKATLDEMSGFAQEQGYLDAFREISYNRFNSKYGQYIEDLLQDEEYFRVDIPLTGHAKLKRCVFDHLRTKMRTSLASGIVVVGYGEEELFPTLDEFIVDGGFFDELRLFEGRKVDIGRGEQSVAVEAFAQADVVRSLLRGYEDKYRREVLRMLRGFLNAQIDDIIENHTKYDEDAKKAIRAAQKRGLKEVVQNFTDELDAFAFKEYTEPTYDVLSHTTKDEMAEIAEALVNITSIKRRVSPERETVGGLVDVAVISKGDGFVWIKRKHYFDGKLNYQFFRNYFPNGIGGEIDV